MTTNSQNNCFGSLVAGSVAEMIVITIINTVDKNVRFMLLGTPSKSDSRT